MFGINLIIDEETETRPREFVLDELRAAIAEKIAAAVLFWGDPGTSVDEAHRSDAKVLIQVGSVEEAKDAATPESTWSSRASRRVAM